MTGIISGIKKHSLAEEAGIKVGEALYAIDGVQVKDIIELSFYASEYEIELEIVGLDGAHRKVKIEKYPDEDLGLEFEAAVFDKVRTCYNNCIFCFVDQMIPGMRAGLYVRDDDYRLSFLYGNFITLTNMKDEDFQRIISTHMSPLYVSVHATNPEVRCAMMRNRFAGDILAKLERLLEAGIQVHTQIVCCPGYNDGEVLAQSFADLYARHPGVLTMAVVPVGLTKQREHLFPMRTFTKEEAAAIVDMVTPWQERCRKETGKSFIYLGDEFYLLAGRPLPPDSWYDGFPQLENGIGLTSSFIAEWNQALKYLPAGTTAAAPAIIPVGESAYKVLQPLLEAFNKQYKAEHRLVAVKNIFFGGKVNVTGLLTGGDILEQVKENEHIILPAVVLNKDNLFLDDMSLQEFKSSCAGKVHIAQNAAQLLQFLTER